MKRFFVFLFILIISIPEALGFVFAEHKQIGDDAFTAFLQGRIKDGTFPDKAAALSFFEETLGLRQDATHEIFYVKALSHPPNLISYGTLNALSADYEENVLSLTGGLTYPYSGTNQIVYLQNLRMGRFQDMASYSEIVKIEPKFAYLALTGRRHSRETLAALFWSDADPPHARATLRNTLYELNKALGGAGLDIAREEVGLAADPELTVDVLEFQRGIDVPRGADHVFRREHRTRDL